MASKYDEDVYENPYFTRFLSDYPNYLETAVNSKGILCVPKYTIATVWKPSQNDIEDHLLLPTKEIVDDDDDFITVSGKIVHLSDGKIIAKDGFPKPRQVPVLFAETFHTDNGGSYRVFCIGGLLNQDVAKTAADASPVKKLSPDNYRQCLEMLWSHSGGHKTRDSLDKILDSYAATYNRLEGETLRSIVDAASTHFTKAMQLLLKDSVVRKSMRHNPEYMDSLKIAVETYVMNAVHKPLFRVIIAAMASEDAEINKITRNLVDLQLTDLGIRKIFSQNIPPAKKELSLLNKYSTPMGRLFCIKRVVAALTKPPKQLRKVDSKDTVTMMTTDDLLPILIFLIIKSEIPNWMANLVYMQHFHFAKSTDDDEYGFYLASFEAALEHIRSGNIKDEIKPWKRERWNSILVTEPTEGSAASSPTNPSRQLSHSTTSIDKFFRLVQEGDEESVRQMLERPQKTTEEIYLKLCHPLCSCDKCEKLQSNLRNNSNLVTAYTRDNRGYTALHIAANYGQGLLIDLLIQNDAVVDATDYLGLTPLHLACQRGYQNIMLLLLHFGADVMATDNEGNTPLHLCCANGHEDCVKALVFYDASTRKLNINCTNEFGNSPLHLAAKWGYESIVKTLLENGADATLLNRKRQTPVSLAMNIKVQRWLQLAAEGLDFQPIRPQFVGPAASSKSRSSSSGSVRRASHRSGSLDVYEPEYSTVSVVTESLEAASESEKRKLKERLFKAIIGGDIQLVKFYLGVETDLEEGEDEDGPSLPLSVSVADMCHPLCQCDKCLGIQKATRRSIEYMSVNAKTSTGYSPIHMAVLHNHSDIVSLLISLNADISAQNHKGLTALHLACCVRNSLITDMLIRARARTEGVDMNGDTPLLIAASNGFYNGVHILVKAGANLNAANNRGNTALHEAVKRDHIDIAKLLLHAGCDPRLPNKHGKLPVDEADDPSLQAEIQAFTTKMNERDIKSQSNQNHRRDVKVVTISNSTAPVKDESQNGKISMKDLFSAFEAKDINVLNDVTASIRSFDRNSSLKRTQTRDKSAPYLGHIARKHSIQSFNRGTLRRTKTVDKYDPLYLYRLFKSSSQDISSLADSSGHYSGSFDGQMSPTRTDSVNSFSSLDDSASLMPFPLSESFDHDETTTDVTLPEFKSLFTDTNPSLCDPDSAVGTPSTETSATLSSAELTSETSSRQQSDDVDSMLSKDIGDKLSTSTEHEEWEITSQEKHDQGKTTSETEESEAVTSDTTAHQEPWNLVNICDTDN